MSTDAAATSAPAEGTAVLVNDWSIKVATVNGSGSQTANNTLLRALFRMGVPVVGKNIFPSNIAGLPTWFVVRATRHGWTARHGDVHLAVCMNPATIREDVAGVAPGGVVVHEQSIGIPEPRDDVTTIAIPFQRLVKDCCDNPRLRRLVVNMIYVGAVARLLGFDRAAVDEAVDHAFASKPKAKGVNAAAIAAGWDWVGENDVPAIPFRAEPMSLTEDRILVDGNSAAALGSAFAGVSVLAWYPITPSSSLGEALIGYLGRFRRDPESGRATYAVIQAEDEIAAAGIAVGAGWAGARAMTATSGPGISLMGEFVGLAWYAEVPLVLFDIQRVGPSTGLPTRTQQADIGLCAHLSHGDTRHPLLFPATPAECFSMAGDAFDLAERFQTPVFVMSDLDLGMNAWMAEPFAYPEQPLDRGKVLDADALADLEEKGEQFRRYADVDGDGIPFRTLPGTEGGRGAYFTRGSGHDEDARYTESGPVYVRNLERLHRKIDGARTRMPAPEEHPAARAGGTPRGVIEFGTTHGAMMEAVVDLERDHGVAVDVLRVRAWPFHPDVRAFVEAHERVDVVEQNRDGQLHALLVRDMPDLAPRLRAVPVGDGLPLSAREVVEALSGDGEGAA